MVRLLFVVSLMSGLSDAALSQTLVPNGEFEEVDTDYITEGVIGAARYWQNPTLASPDYFNGASAAGYPAPLTFLGPQDARSGSGFAGLYQWDSLDAQGWREYMMVHLTETLEAGRCYSFKMYFSLPLAMKWPTANLGVYFSADSLAEATYHPLPYVPQIKNDSVNYPVLQTWTAVTGQYIATGNEAWLTIGNFSQDSGLDTGSKNLSGAIAGGYVYIDDVSLVSCQQQSVALVASQARVSIYPNPFTSRIRINTPPDLICRFTLYNAMGKAVASQSIKDVCSINTHNLPPGTYWYRISGLSINQSGVLNKQ